MPTLHYTIGGDDNKGDDNKNSEDPGKINDNGDDIGTRVGQGHDNGVDDVGL